MMRIYAALTIGPKAILDIVREAPSVIVQRRDRTQIKDGTFPVPNCSFQGMFSPDLTIFSVVTTGRQLLGRRCPCGVDLIFFLGYFSQHAAPLL